MRTFVRRRASDTVFFLLLIIALGAFAMVIHIHPQHTSRVNHFIYQAQAWLQGRLDISRQLQDVVVVNGKYYLVFPPLPALLMVPFVAVLGNRFSDIWFTWIFAALNMLLLYRTLEVMRHRQIISRTPLENGIITLTFGFGTIALWLCLGGRVWFTAQTISTFGIMITLHATLSRRWWLATLGVGIVALTRTSEVLIGVIPLVVYLRNLGIGRRMQKRRVLLPGRWPSLRELTGILMPLAIAFLLLLIRNKLYFGSFLSLGYDIQQQQFYPNVQYGLFSWHYIWPNIVIDFLRWPGFSFTGVFDVNPRPDLIMDAMGTSIFFSTPLLAIFLFTQQGKTAQPWLRSTLWITLALLLLPILLYSYEGWNQVGARYLFPLYPPLFLLLAQREASLDARWIALAGLSVFINSLLARVFWMHALSTTFVLGSAGAALLGCVTTLILLRREKRKQQISPPISADASLYENKNEMPDSGSRVQV